MLVKAQRFDIKGNRYLDTPLKYYAGNCGLIRDSRPRKTRTGDILLNPKSIETL